MKDRIREFLAGSPHAVAGASPQRHKWGNRVLRCYRQHGMRVYCVHPRHDEIEGVPCHRRLAELPEPVRGLSIVTPPGVTERLVEEAAEAGIRHLWMQPGAESPAALARAEQLGLEVIAGGPCILAELGFRDAG